MMSPQIRAALAAALRTDAAAKVALADLLEREDAPVHLPAPLPLRWMSRAASGLEKAVFAKAVAALRSTGHVAKPGREMLCDREALDHWVGEHLADEQPRHGPLGRVAAVVDDTDAPIPFDSFARRARMKKRAAP